MTRVGQEWSNQELELYRECKEMVASTNTLREDLAEALLALTSSVFLRAHHQESALRKSEELSRLIRLCGRPSLFTPYPDLASARTELLISILSGSDQRPVLEAAGLALLALQLKEVWGDDPALTLVFQEHLVLMDHWVLPLFVLTVELGEMSSEEQYEMLKTMKLSDKRLRLVELIGVVDVYDDEPEVVKQVVAQTFEGIFDGVLLPEHKTALAKRFFKELDRRRVLRRHERWKLLVDPLVLQNRGNPFVLDRVLTLIEPLESVAAEPYLVYYADALTPIHWQDRFYELAEERGTVRLISKLYPLTQDRGFFGGMSAAAKRAQKIIDTIIEREGLDGGVSGGLSVADAGGGELSVVHATEGALSLNANPGAMIVPETRDGLWSRFIRWVRSLFG